jgi:hypothetical protein
MTLTLSFSIAHLEQLVKAMLGVINPVCSTLFKKYLFKVNVSHRIPHLHTTPNLHMS